MAKQNSNRPPLLTPGRSSVWVAAVGYAVSIFCALIPPVILMMFVDPEAPATGGAGASELGLPLQMGLGFLLGALLVRIWHRKTYQPDDLGLLFPRNLQPWVWAVAGALFFIAVGQAATRLIPALTKAGESVAKTVGIGESIPRDLTIIISMAVLAPLGEEILFRGLIFRGLHDTWLRRSGGRGRFYAFLVPGLLSGLLFAMSHGGEGQEAQMLFLILYGLIGSFLYWWTGSLVVAVAAHAVTNMINAGILAVGAGGFSHPAMWGLVAITPALTVGTMWILNRVFGPKEIHA